MNEFERYLRDGAAAGCPPDQMQNFIKESIVLQPRQLAASAAARRCDHPDGPTAIGFGGARGGGKSHWLIAQMGADDCQRCPGLKCLLLRKIGKSNRENFDDLRRKVFKSTYKFSRQTGTLEFPNGSRIIAGHFQSEKDIDSYLGLEYDVIGIEEATTLTAQKYNDIKTCNRTSKPNWRPRIYSTTNPGGIGHVWYRQTYVFPRDHKNETSTRYISAVVDDNKFANAEYKKILEETTGWRKPAWLHGNWDLPAGQFFTNFRPDVHILKDFDDRKGVKWVAALDYGYTHYTVFLLGCYDRDNNLIIVDEHAAQKWIPARHAPAIKEMLARHMVHRRADFPNAVRRQEHGLVFEFRSEVGMPTRFLDRIFAGADLFSLRHDGKTIASHYDSFGIPLRPANTNRAQGWAEILHLLGDPDAGIKPKLYIHARCRRLLETLPFLQHDPDHPVDVLKCNTDEEGLGGDDAADALRYLVSTTVNTVHMRKLTGF